MTTALLLIDMQNDFCMPDGNLFVSGAEEDCARTTGWIRRNKQNISAIHATLDTHTLYHIAHPVFWKDRDGNPPHPYTSISYQDFADGLYTPIDSSMQQYVREYLLGLESKGRYILTVWPPHCLLATYGHCIQKDVNDALREWEMFHLGKNVNFILKALNFRTEHYSAIQAEIPDPGDPQTRTNFALIEKLKQADQIVIAGEALSHCVANTVRDIAAYIPYSKMILLIDCTSPVAGYENDSRDFLDKAQAKGLMIASSDQFSLM